MRLKKSFHITTTVGCLLAVSAVSLPVQAADGVEFDFSGQISRALTFADNGVDTDTLFVDNTNSGSRLRLKGKVDISDSLQAGVYWETQYQDNASHSIDIGDSDNSSTFTSRFRELWFKGGWGKVYLGQGNGAANGTSEVDFSGTTIADYSGNNLDDGISFADMNGNKIVKNGDVFSNFDGLSRNDRLRYDLPKFGPLGIAVSVGQDRAEVGVRYSAKLANGGKFGAALGAVDNTDKFTQTGVSASLLLGSGLNLTGHWGERKPDAGGVDPSGYYVKVGQKFGASKEHDISLGYQEVDDLDQVGDVATRTNLSYVYHFPKRGIEIFITAQNAQLDRVGAQLEDQTQVSVGSRIKF